VGETPLSIVQVVLSLGRGGLESLAVDLACALKQRGLRPVIVALDAGGPLEERLKDAGIDYAILGGRRLWDPGFHITFARLLRRLRATVVHTHMFAPLLHALPATRIARIKRLVHTEHSFEYLESRRDLQLALSIMSRLTDQFTVVGQRMQPFYLEAIGVAPEKFRVIVNGVDVAPRGGQAERAAIRAELRLPQHAVVVGTAGRLAPEKNIELLLRASAVVLASGVPIHVVVLGEGECRAELEQLAVKLGIGDAVSFLGWRNDVKRVLGALDVYALTSHSEGLPIAVLEGMAAELPVISTVVGDMPFLVRDGETGFLIAQHDPEVFADRLRYLATSSDIRVAMGQAARREVLRSYDRTLMIERYMEAYGL
jgi:glycosyltransferase involved in cell wall biosynthesis